LALNATRKLSDAKIRQMFTATGQVGHVKQGSEEGDASDPTHELSAGNFLEVLHCSHNNHHHHHHDHHHYHHYYHHHHHYHHHYYNHDCAHHLYHY
jgi:hypothetical protein